MKGNRQAHCWFKAVNKENKILKFMEKNQVFFDQKKMSKVLKMKDRLDYMVSDCRLLPSEDRIKQVKGEDKDDLVAQLRLY